MSDSIVEDTYPVNGLGKNEAVFKILSVHSINNCSLDEEKLKELRRRITEKTKPKIMLEHGGISIPAVISNIFIGVGDDYMIYGRICEGRLEGKIFEIKYNVANNNGELRIL